MKIQREGRTEKQPAYREAAPSRSLALLGGAPTFYDYLHVGRPSIGDRRRFLARVAEILDRRWFTNDGPVVREFERRIEELIGVKNCVATCNATVALEIAIRALDLTGEVIVPSYTFVATAHALQWQRITPVFADIDPGTHNIDPASIERLITSKTTGIIGVHTWGRSCDTAAIRAIAASHGLKEMYDAAHAFGCTHRGQRIGNFGVCEVFSFHATKFLNSFEGGAVVTNDDNLADRIRLMRNFGFAGYDQVVYLGTNGKMTEICAAMGLTSLEVMDDIVTTNRRNYEAYRKGLYGLPGVHLIVYDPAEHSNYQYVVVEVDSAVAPLRRDELVAVLHSENVLARRYFWPGCHRMEPYVSYRPNAGALLPNTERIADRVVLLPSGQTVTIDIVKIVCEIIKAAFIRADDVRREVARLNRLAPAPGQF